MGMITLRGDFQLLLVKQPTVQLTFFLISFPCPLSLSCLLLLQDFIFRYAVLGRQVGPQVTGDKERSAAILHQYNTGKKDWQVGKTKVSTVALIAAFLFSVKTIMQQLMEESALRT